jgi:hypothetical protein
MAYPYTDDDERRINAASRLRRGVDVATTFDTRRSPNYGPGPDVIPGMREQGNIDYETRPRVPQPDLSTATVRSASIGTPRGEVLIPTISDTGRQMSYTEAAAEYNKTGRHLGVFESPQAANEYARKFHQEMGPSTIPTSPAPAPTTTPTVTGAYNAFGAYQAQQPTTVAYQTPTAPINAVNQARPYLASEREDLLNQIEGTFYGGGHAIPSPSPTPTPVPRSFPVPTSAPNPLLAEMDDYKRRYGFT